MNIKLDNFKVFEKTHLEILLFADAVLSTINRYKYKIIIYHELFHSQQNFYQKM